MTLRRVNWNNTFLYLYQLHWESHITRNYFGFHPQTFSCALIWFHWESFFITSLLWIPWGLMKRKNLSMNAIKKSKLEQHIPLPFTYFVGKFHSLKLLWVLFSFIVEGVLRSYITLIFYGSISMLLLLTTNPNNLSNLAPNIHLLGFNLNLYFQNHSNSFMSTTTWASPCLDLIIISSTYPWFLVHHIVK